MKLDTINIDPVAYATQGNAILGIRDSGKTYTATKIAELLLQAGIPFVAFDPVGVWPFLKVGAGDHKGYNVVVAGGDRADIELTPDNAASIVRAAMTENIPLVIDLYTMGLSKAAWRRIVSTSVEVLMYENKTHGVRHIFFEEAAEFVPQRVMGSNSVVYSEIEQLARMGRNSKLGYTLINQRAEEVNKAVLELCDCLFLHRQKGRHSITALSKWLSIASTTNTDALIHSLPELPQGQCWYWGAGSNIPTLIKIPRKFTVHPDIKDINDNTLNVVSTDVTQFVERLQKTLKKQESSKPKIIEKVGSKARVTVEAAELARAVDPRIPELEKELENLRQELDRSKDREAVLKAKFDTVASVLRPQYDGLSKVFAEIESAPMTKGDVTSEHWQVWLAKLYGKNRTMLEVLIKHKRLSEARVRFLIGVPNNSTYRRYRSELVKLGLAKQQGDELVLMDV